MNQKIRAERDVEADLEEWKNEQLKHHRVGAQGVTSRFKGCHFEVNDKCTTGVFTGASHLVQLSVRVGYNVFYLVMIFNSTR